MRTVRNSLCAALVMFVAVSCSTGGDTSEQGGVMTSPSSTSAAPAADDDVEQGTTPAGSDDTPATEGGGDGDTRDAYVDALARNFMDGDPSEGTFTLGSDSAFCAAEAWVDLIGSDALDASGVSADELADPQFSFTDLGLDMDQATAMIDALPTCGVDLVSLVVEVVAYGADDDQTRCARDILTEDVVRRALTAGLVSDAMPADLEEDMTGLEACAA